MHLSLSASELREYVSRQVNHFFPDKQIVKMDLYKSSVDLALDRLNYCFKHSALKNYFNKNQTYFNHLYSDQYLMFLWFLANTMWENGVDQPLLNKLYYLNKALHAFDCMYNTKLPNIFFVFHGVGTVLGKAEYADFLTVFHNCAVGVHDNKYPIFKKGVTLAAQSSVMGACIIGNRVSIGANTSIFKTKIDNDMTAYRDSDGQLIFRRSSRWYGQTFYNMDIKLK